MEEIIREEDLKNWLLKEIPKLKPYFEKEDEKRERDWNSYALFSDVLRPLVKNLLFKKSFKDIKEIFHLLEILANNGDRLVKSQLLLVVEEELSEELHQLWPFLGPTLESRVKDEITSYSLYKSKYREINRHFNKDDYVKRWEQEVRKIGGWHKLTIPYLLFIRYKLVKEFDIKGIVIYEPGGAEWIEGGLPWPLPLVT